MRKKVLHYIKNIILIVLVVSFAFPSFAVLSGSDGSAFITKEEFDVAVSNLDNRMNVFEAGISSKIDTQVSSYLDRNGIWKATKQTCCLTFAPTSSGRNEAVLWDATTSNMGSIYAAFNNRALGASGSRRLYNKQGYWNIGIIKVIENINKTGLLRANFVTGISNGTNDVAGNIEVSKIAGSNEFQCVLVGYGLSQDESIRADEYADDNTLETDIIYNEGDPSKCIVWNFWDYTYIKKEDGYEKKRLSVPHGSLFLLGFVEKGKPLYYCIGTQLVDAVEGNWERGNRTWCTISMYSFDAVVY